MKITKKPKTALVQYESVLSFVSRYTCPACKVVFVGGVSKSTTRFRCSCGQELIVKHED